jgi:hypothetical protein
MSSLSDSGVSILLVIRSTCTPCMHGATTQRTRRGRTLTVESPGPRTVRDRAYPHRVSAAAVRAVQGGLGEPRFGVGRSAYGDHGRLRSSRCTSVTYHTTRGVGVSSCWPQQVSRPSVIECDDHVDRAAAPMAAAPVGPRPAAPPDIVTVMMPTNPHPPKARQHPQRRKAHPWSPYKYTVNTGTRGHRAAAGPGQPPWHTGRNKLLTECRARGTVCLDRTLYGTVYGERRVRL